MFINNIQKYYDGPGVGQNSFVYYNIVAMIFISKSAVNLH